MHLQYVTTALGGFAASNTHVCIYVTICTVDKPYAHTNAVLHMYAKGRNENECKVQNIKAQDHQL